MEEKDKQTRDFVESFKKATDSVIETGKELTKTASQKIDESAKTVIEKTKSSPTFKKLKTKTDQAAKIGIEKGKEIHQKGPSVLARFGCKLLSMLEKFVGAIRRGTQYGKTSMEILEQFAKMKELGIITDEEFEAKKKELLDRI